MNVMIVSVTERTNEIGLRKAIGATSRSVLFQFLIEALVISLGGGVIGIGLGALFTFFVGNWLNLVFQVSLQFVWMALGISLIIGLTFGIWPARRASRLKPMEAMRFE